MKYWLVLYYVFPNQLIDGHSIVDGNLGPQLDPMQTYEQCMEKAYRAAYGDLYDFDPWGIELPLKIACVPGPVNAWEFQSPG